MQPNRTLFFVIIGLALLLTIGVVAGGFLFFGSSGEMTPLGRSASPIQIVVAPAIEPWVRQAAQVYNQMNAQAEVRVVAAGSLIPRSQLQSTPQNPPVAAWLPEASFVAALGEEQGVQFNEPQSVASTVLAWGGYKDKLAQFNQTYGDLTWENLRRKAVAPGDFLKLVIASPRDSGEGLAALLSATAAAGQSGELSGNSVSAANDWLTETLGDGNAQTPPRPAEAFASVQGRTLGDVGLLSMTSWQRAGLQNRADFTLTPVEPNVTLDYPFVILTGPQVSPEAQETARRFRQFLLEPNQQANLDNSFFDRATADPVQNSVQADAAAVDRLLGWAERVLR
jgi:hypothetical protein